MSQTPDSAEYSKTIPRKPGYYVYRLFAADGTPLYVGRIGDNGPGRVRERFANHRNHQPWWPEVDKTRTDVAIFADHSEIVEEERRQIEKLHPRYNRRLLGMCSKGHDLTLPGSRNTEGKCRKCANARHRAYNTSPQGRASYARYSRTTLRAASNARYKAKRRYGPVKGQGGLW